MDETESQTFEKSDLCLSVLQRNVLLPIKWLQLYLLSEMRTESLMTMERRMKNAEERIHDFQAVSDMVQ